MYLKNKNNKTIQVLLQVIYHVKAAQNAGFSLKYQYNCGLRSSAITGPFTTRRMFG